MKTILITGCNGLVGYELAMLLLEKKNYKVYGVSRSVPVISHPNFTHLQIDFTRSNFESSLPDNIDVIYHLAQSEHFREFPERVKDIFDVNTYSTLTLLEYCRKNKGIKFIYASSGGIYGTSETGFKEDDSIAAHHELGFYLSTKLCSEILIENYSSFFDVIICRLFFVYGKRQRKTMLIPRLIENIRMGQAISLQGESGIKINPIHVSDAATALGKCLELNGSRKMNIAGNDILFLKDIANEIAAQLGVEPKFNFVNSEPNHLVGDNTMMREHLFDPKIGFKKGIKMYIDSLKSE